MKRYTSFAVENDYKICGAYNGSPLAVSRAVTESVLEKEVLHSHDGYEFYIFLKGKAELEVEGEIIKVIGGDVLLIEAGEKHKVMRIVEELDYMIIKEANTEKTIFEE